MRWDPPLRDLDEVSARVAACAGRWVRLRIIPAGSQSGYEQLARVNLIGMTGDEVMAAQVVDGELRSVMWPHDEIVGIVPLRVDDPRGWNADPTDEELGLG